MMSRDISNQLQLPISRDDIMRKELFIESQKILENSIPESKKDWDEYAGERWGSIFVAKKTVAYLNQEFPILLIQKELKTIGNSFKDLVVLTFSHNDIGEYSIDPILFEHWSQGRSKTGGLDAKYLSASDIFCATIL